MVSVSVSIAMSGSSSQSTPTERRRPEHSSQQVKSPTIPSTIEHWRLRL